MTISIACSENLRLCNVTSWQFASRQGQPLVEWVIWLGLYGSWKTFFPRGRTRGSRKRRRIRNGNRGWVVLCGIINIPRLRRLPPSVKPYQWDKREEMYKKCFPPPPQLTEKVSIANAPGSGCSRALSENSAWKQTNQCVKWEVNVRVQLPSVRSWKIREALSAAELDFRSRQMCSRNAKIAFKTPQPNRSSNVITFKGMSATHVIYVSDCSGVINKNSHV